MASPFKVFRKYRASLLVATTILAMFGFVFIPALMDTMQLRGSQNPTLVRTDKFGELTGRDVAQMREERARLAGVMQSLASFMMQSGNQMAAREVAMMMQRIGSDTEESVVRTWLLAKQAEKQGLIVDNRAINDLLRSLTQNQISNEDLRRAFQANNLSETDVFRILRRDLLAVRLEALFEPTVAAATPAQRWDYFLRLNRKARIEAVALPVKEFVGQVKDPDEQTLEAFYTEYRNKLNLSFSPEPGFRQPQEIDLRYFSAEMDRYMAEAITEAEVLEEYEKNKQLYDRSQDSTGPAEVDPRDVSPLELPTLDKTPASTEGGLSFPSSNGTSGPALPDLSSPSGAAPAETPTGSAPVASVPGGESAEKSSPTAKEGMPENAEQQAPGGEGQAPAAVDEDASGEAAAPDANESSSAPRQPLFRLAAYQADDAEAPDAGTGGAIENPLRPAAMPAGENEAGTNAEAKSDGGKKAGEKKKSDQKKSAGKKAAEPKAKGQKTADSDSTSPKAPSAADSPPPGENSAVEKPAPTEPVATEPAATEPAAAGPAGEGEMTPDPPSLSLPPAPAGVGEAATSGETAAGAAKGPSDEVKRQIRGVLAMRKIQDAFDAIAARVDDYRSQQVQWEVTKKGTEPRPLDYEAMAAEYKLSTGATGLVNAFELAQLPLGRASTREGSVPQVAFGQQLNMLRPMEAFDVVARTQYMFFKTDEVKEHVLKLTGEKPRRQVIDTWKMVQARELARKEAEKLAAEVAKSGKSLSDFFSGTSQREVIKPDAFTWMTQPEVPSFSMLTNFEISNVPGVEMPGNDFMREVFRLRQGEAGAAMNQPHTTAYVVRVTELSPSDEDLWQRFQSTPYASYMGVAQSDQVELYRSWLESIEESAGLKWVRDPDQLREDPDSQ